MSLTKRILIINVPHPAIGSRIPDDHLPPLGLLCIAGPLIDAGHRVRLLDAELAPLSLVQIVEQTIIDKPDIVMFGHSGSSTAHPIIVELSILIKAKLPNIITIYGGVHPSYFWQETLTKYPTIDCIVRGEGEETVIQLVNVLASGEDLTTVAGIAYRNWRGDAVANQDALIIKELDNYRIAWELIDFDKYSYWGGYKAVVVQFSRGCPHLCSYCGQRGYWTKWRHRDPIKFAKEIAWLHREHGVVVFNFADENFSSSKRVWRTFLEAIIAENINIRLIASMRADDIVRDADILYLYQQAGFERFLIGMEHTDAETLKIIKKGGSIQKDQQAIQLLRKHHILSLATWVAGFSDESDKTMWQALKQLLAYDPDQIQMLYVTPHRWTSFGQEVAGRKIIQPNLTRWDYKHQILDTPYLKPWRLFFWVKSIELIMQLRPKAIKRFLFHPVPKIKQGIRWYYKIGRRVWFHEVFNFLFKDKRVKPKQTLKDYWGNIDIAIEQPVLAKPKRIISKDSNVASECVVE